MLSYNFTRSGQLTSKEFHFLAIVDSFSGESHLKLKDYAEIMNTSIRTLKRVLRSLKEKGFIKVRYGLYKSLHLAVETVSNILWKPNEKKSKGPKSSIKRAKDVPSNTRENKEINKGVRYPIFKEERTEVSSEMPKDIQNMLSALKEKLRI